MSWVGDMSKINVKQHERWVEHTVEKGGGGGEAICDQG